MLLSFLTGLLLVILTIEVIVLIVLTIEWLKNKIAERLAARENHKIAFVDMTETVNSVRSGQVELEEEISMDELEKMCADHPYIIADYDIETGDVDNYTSIKANEIDGKLARGVKQQGGMVIFDG